MNTSIFLVNHSILWVGEFLSSGFIKNTLFFFHGWPWHLALSPVRERKNKVRSGLTTCQATEIRMLEDRVGNCDAEERGFPGGSILPPTSQQKSQDCRSANCNFTWFFILPHCAACEILVPRPEIELTPLAVKLPSPNRWITREFPIWFFFFFKNKGSHCASRSKLVKLGDPLTIFPDQRFPRADVDEEGFSGHNDKFCCERLSIWSSPSPSTSPSPSLLLDSIIPQGCCCLNKTSWENKLSSHT